MLSVHYAESADTFAHLLRFYAPTARLCLDVTYGGGTLVKRTPCRVIGVDLDPTTKAHVRADARQLPFLPQTFDVVVYDPPYLYGSAASHMGPVGMKTWTNARSTWKTPSQLIDLSTRVAQELGRVLKPTGVVVVKVMDSRFKGRLIRNHDLVIGCFEQQGFVLCDQLVYIRTVTGSFVNNKSAQCAHGYYLIFRPSGKVKDAPRS